MMSDKKESKVFLFILAHYYENYISVSRYNMQIQWKRKQQKRKKKFRKMGLKVMTHLVLM